MMTTQMMGKVEDAKSYMINSKSSRVEMYVAGTRFEIPKEKLVNYPGTLLGKMLPKLCKEKGGDISFNRPVEIFKAIHTYFLTDKLHMPLNVCPGQFAEELEFWGVGSELLEPCCLYRFLSFRQQEETSKRFRKNIPTDNLVTSGGYSCRQRLWCIIDNRESSVPAKIYLAFILTFVLLSLASLSLSTVQSLQRKMTICEARDLLFNDNDYDDEVKEYFENNVDCSKDAEIAMMSFLGEYAGYSDADFDEKMGKINRTNPHEVRYFAALKLKKKLKQVKIPDKLTRLQVFDRIDLIVHAVFTVDLILRLLACPSIIMYYKSLLNISDSIVLICGIVGFVLEKNLINFTYETGDLDILIYFQQLRVFRLLRIFQHVAAIKVLAFCFKENFKEILVLLLFLFVGVNFFANFLYFVETDTMKSIPTAWWWGLITMTTVGYGDIYPTSALGRIIGACCAISGVIVLALVIPIFVNNFLALYELAHLLGKEKTGKLKPITLQTLPTKHQDKGI
ncbi:potassium voltage-gated channel protein egl-36-like [Magallana gigas]|uniref:potassium voltage-gated channel protein egl-36-like n=1 Tax=Magallana gigas TaxID=29159 RepID=UPI00333FB42B